MSATFYRKYRPSQFADIIGQDTAVAVLTQSLIRDKVAHAYLLTGPRGTGKTTLARLFARALNCRDRKNAEPCGKCAHCLAMNQQNSLDVIEIDAASHTGVDNIRELRDTITTMPVLGSHKVYIIDEAHMLSLGAWNALLKTLEEPPAHVVFLLATTNVAKVPETILSRSLRLDLKRFPLEQLLKKLQRIAKAENINIDDESLLLIARSAEGGMRDAEVLFTQIATLEESPITIDRTSLLLGATNLETVHTLLTAISERDLTAALTVIRQLGDHGINMNRFTETLLRYLRQALYASVDSKSVATLAIDFTKDELTALTGVATLLGSDRIVECLERFQEAENLMKVSPLPELPLEIAVVKLIPRTQKNHPEPPTGESVKDTQQTPSSVSSPKKSLEKNSVAKVSEVSPRGDSLPNIDSSKVEREWRAIVEHARSLNASLGVALSTTELLLGEGIVTLAVKYPFHQDRLEKPENRLTIDTAFATILGFAVPWQVKVSDQVRTPERPALISQALEALGGQLVQDNA